MDIVHTLTSLRLNWRIAALFALLAALVFYPPPPIFAQSPPETPASVTVTRADGSLTASGYAVANATKYHITYTSDGGQSWSAAAIPSDNYNADAITINAVANAKSYIVGVRAGNAHGWSKWVNSPSVGPYTPTPPASPASVSVTRADGTLTASWQAVDNADTYHVTYTDNDAQSWQLATLDHPATPGAVTITIAVANAKSYIVGVRAKNVHGGSNWVNSPSVGPYTSPPPPSVASVSVTRTDAALTASWQSVASATSYHVTYTDNNAQSWQLAALNHPATEGTVTITIAADNSKSYIVGVRAKNEGGGSAWVNSPSVGPYKPPPDQPTGLNATAGDGGSATITWNNPGDASITGYQYQHREEGGAWGQNNPIEGSGASTTSHKVTGLAVGATHYFNLQALNASGASQGRQVSVRIPAILPGPDSVTITTRGTGTLSALWTAVPGVFKYYIQTSNSGDDWKTFTIETATTGTSVTLHNRDDSLNYTVLVYAATENGHTKWTESYPAGTSTSPAIAPQSVSLSRSGTALTATWHTVLGAASYNINISGDKGKTWYNPTDDAHWNAPTVTDGVYSWQRTIDANTSYTIRVRSNNTTGASAWTQSDENTPKPPAPASVTVTSRSNTQSNATLDVSWSVVTEATSGYNVQHSSDNGATWSAATKVTGATTTTINIDATKDYFVRVQAENTAGKSGWTTSAISRAIPVPPAPATVTPTRGKGSITLTWDASAEATTYDIACSVFGGNFWEVCKENVTDAQRTAGVTFTQIYNRTAGKMQNIYDRRDYVFAVRGRNANGAGEWTRTTAWPAVPERIASVTATPRDADGITLSMTVPPANGGYHITRIQVDCRTSSDGGTKWSGWFMCTDAETKVNPISGSTFTAEIDSVDNYSTTLTYQARARAHNGLGNAWDWRESAVIPTTPGAPNISNYASSTLTWSPPSDTGSGSNSLTYNVYCRADATAVWSKVVNGAAVPAGNPPHTTSLASHSACTGTDSQIDLSVVNVYESERTRWPILLTVGGITATTATLTIGNYDGSWYVKQTAPSTGTCSSEITGTTHSLGSLTAGAAYTYKAYSGSACANADELASASFTVGYSVSNLNKTAVSGSGCTVGYAGGSARQCATAFTTGARVGGYVLVKVTGDFNDHPGSPGNISVAIHAADANNSKIPASSSLVTLSGSNPTSDGTYAYTCPASQAGCYLDANTTYFVVMSAPSATSGVHYYILAVTKDDAEDKLPATNGWSIANDGYAKNGANAWQKISTSDTNTDTGMISVVARDQELSLSASGIARTAATLHLGGGPASWWYKANKTPDNTCQGPAIGKSKTLSGLTTGASYTYTAYSDSSCANSLASHTFTTNAAAAPAAPAAPTLTTGNRQLAMAWTAPADNASAITDYDLQYRQVGATNWSPALISSVIYSPGSQGNQWSDGPTGKAINLGPAINLTNALTGLTVSKVTEGGISNVYRIAEPAGAFRLALNAYGTGTYQARYADTAPTTGNMLTHGTLLWTQTSNQGSNFSGSAWTPGPLPAGAHFWITTTTNVLSSLVKPTVQADAVTVPSPLAAQLSGLTNGTNYEAQVRAVNAVGKGAWSPSGTMKAGLPARSDAPTLISGNRQVTVKWNAATDNGSTITDYDLRHSSDGGTTWTIVEMDAAANTARSYAVTGLANGTALVAQLRATNTHGDSLWSPSSASVEAGTPDEPAAPTLTPGDRQVTVTWTAPADNGSAITDYDLRYCSANCATPSNWTLFESGTSTSLTAAITSLANGTPYQIQVRAENARGSGGWSPSTTLSGLAASAITNTTATLTLTRSGHTGNWYIKQTAPTTGTCSASAITGTTHNLSSLTASTAQTWTAYSDSSCTTVIALVTFTTMPSSLTASSVSNTTATLTIGSHTGNWYVKETSPSTNTTCSTAISTTTHDLSSLTDGVPYRYDAYSDSACTTTIAWATFNTTLYAPTGVSHSTGSCNWLGFNCTTTGSWSRNSSATGSVGYEAQYKDAIQTDWTHFTTVQPTTGGSFSHSVSSAAGGDVRVRAFRTTGGVTIYSAWAE